MKIEKNWKAFFIALLGFNVLFLLSVMLFIFWPTSEVEPPEKEFIEEEEGAEFTINSSKENLTELVNAYIDKLLKDDEDKYRVSFEDQVHVTGSVDAFMTEVPISISLTPIVQENGDIILQTEDMSLGLLNLPNNKILEYVNNRVDPPEWLVINPKEENIYIAVTQMEIKSNFKIRAQQIDLENNNISFRIKVPNQSLGL